jgi:hypothetical protein
MMEPTIYMQLGISNERYIVISKEIESILKTNETTGNMILMVQSSAKMSVDEKYYAVYMIAKQDIQRKLAGSLPPFAKGIIGNLMEK